MKSTIHLVALIFAYINIAHGWPEFCFREKTDRLRTVVEYFGNLTCDVRPNFCAFIYYVEYDFGSFNEDVEFIPFQCTKTGTLSHHSFVIFRNGDGGDNFYEPMIKIIHDCTSLPKTKYSPAGTLGVYDYYLKEVDINYNVDYFNYTVDVSDKGLFVEELNETNKRFLNWIAQDTPQVREWLAIRKPANYDIYDDEEREC
ncbi:hypothetical protein CAEBREN_19411 [Caenorhabditis brenneri]|uniref:Uncharacterized protein n=1 Tax=Caenorhabditis brenneri TaxID=135651 RepID=G0N4D2_CAEBE|nr:hypothetical protein CAEBREN_19411 [Caenorhabditis brenneri]